jgi:hypothetical protein
MIKPVRLSIKPEKGITDTVERFPEMMREGNKDLYEQMLSLEHYYESQQQCLEPRPAIFSKFSFTV